VNGWTIIGEWIKIIEEWFGEGWGMVENLVALEILK